MTRSIQWIVASAMLLTGALAVSAATDFALIDAVKRGNTAVVKALLAKKADVNAPDVDTSGALTSAFLASRALTTAVLPRFTASMSAKSVAALTASAPVNNIALATIHWIDRVIRLSVRA